MHRFEHFLGKPSGIKDRKLRLTLGVHTLLVKLRTALRLITPLTITA